ncbi:MAG TPA: adenylate/guanylate cyclase domain-containing protein, partial [Candidatus Acidoferrales bacterium]|nr:adenylate/guanylate cyclase domain-containing protein [Candidatus Acidoferrales bacterium]
MTARRHPTGNVTFLFTDIEGSTARWESHREAMQAALRSHDAILKSSIEAHRGYVFKTIGDAFCAAFSNPLDAVRAAAEAQDRIAEADWDAIGGLRVRMAIHAGETDERGGDYYGPPVNRVARLLAAGHGGQVLVSGYVSDAVGAQPADGITLRPLGTLPLRDLKEPERVHQLLTPGLSPVDKPLRSMQTPPNNLPRQTSAFVGRTDDAMRVAEMLRHGSLVTIVGAGGIGKTRLALEVASHLLHESTDGAWFVDLAPLTEPSLVAGSILATLGAQQSGETPAIDQLVSYLRLRSLLLILDNCEHVVEEVAAIVHAILARCPETAVLATSREALRVNGEHEYHLATLDEMSAIELFADRARAANPRFALDDTSREAVAKICHRLDGIALGIELAAARVKSMPVSAIAERLELRMLSGGGRDRNARQQTMNALVGWSYDLLTDDEKSFFRRLAVFAGGMTLESVTAVCADEALDEWGVLDLLTSLVEKSLLVAEPPEAPTRYRMLEPIREYARERLAQGSEIEDENARHARGFADIANRAYIEWDTTPRTDWLERQERELDNDRSAMRWSLTEEHDSESGARIAGSVGPVFLRLSLLREGIRWGELALERAANSPANEARLHYTLSMLHNNLGAYAEALQHAETAAQLFRTEGDERGLARALSQVAQQFANCAQPQRSTIVAEEALSLARRLDDPPLLASVLARCANARQALETSREQYRESVALFRASGRDDDAARVLHWWASTEAVDGDLSEAARIVETALTVTSGELDMWLASAGATIYWSMGDRERAVPLTRRALVLAGEVAHPSLLPSVMTCVAAIASQSDPGEAARLFAYAEQSRLRSGYAVATIERTISERLRGALSTVLGEAQFNEAIAEGSKWTAGQAYA